MKWTVRPASLCRNAWHQSEFANEDGLARPYGKMMEIIKMLSVLHSGSIFQNGPWGTRELSKLKPTPQPVALGQAMKPSVGWFAMSRHAGLQCPSLRG